VIGWAAIAFIVGIWVGWMACDWTHRSDPGD